MSAQEFLESRNAKRAALLRDSDPQPEPQLSKTEPVFPPALSSSESANSGSGEFRRGPVLLRVCMYCQSFLGTKSNGGLPTTAISHGICPDCYARMMKEGEFDRANNGAGAAWWEIALGVVWAMLLFGWMMLMCRAARRK